MKFSIIVAAYNVAEYLEECVESLVNQNFPNSEYEVLIVDDGSKDNTKDVVSSFVKEGKINIHYVQQENGGKHRAINNGVGLATGELFFILDSDDILPNNALELVVKTYQPIKHEMSFAGVSGIDGNFDGRIIGSGLPDDSIDCNSVDIRYKFHVIGDMKEVFRTSVMKEFPFPDIEGEKFCPEALVWNRIAKKYKLRYFNKEIYLNKGYKINIKKLIRWEVYKNERCNAKK